MSADSHPAADPEKDTHPDTRSAAPPSARHGKNRLEWCVFATSLLLVLGALGLLIYQEINSESHPPRIEARIGVPEPHGDWLRVPVTLSNTGDLPAENVQVTVGGEGQEATASFTIQFLPQGAERKAWVAFPQHQIPARIVPQVIGYEEP